MLVEEVGVEMKGCSLAPMGSVRDPLEIYPLKSLWNLLKNYGAINETTKVSLKY